MLPTIFGENLFDDFFDNRFGMMPWNDAEHTLYGKHAKNLMKTDVRETENTYELDVDLPGFSKDEIQIDLENGMLTISAAKGLDKDEEDKKGRYIRKERYTGECSRSFYVGEGLMPEDITASYDSGILRLSMPKSAPKQLPKSTSVAIQ